MAEMPLRPGPVVTTLLSPAGFGTKASRLQAALLPETRALPAKPRSSLPSPVREQRPPRRLSEGSNCAL